MVHLYNIEKTPLAGSLLTIFHSPIKALPLALGAAREREHNKSHQHILSLRGSILMCCKYLHLVSSKHSTG